MSGVPWFADASLPPLPPQSQGLPSPPSPPRVCLFYSDKVTVLLHENLPW